MARRIDYYDDPEAPAANSLVPSANVVVVDDAGALLLIHRTDNDNWALPGGAMDLGESLLDTAVRETHEETGLAVGLGRPLPGSEYVVLDAKMAARVRSAWNSMLFQHGSVTLTTRVLTPAWR